MERNMYTVAYIPHADSLFGNIALLSRLLRSHLNARINHWADCNKKRNKISELATEWGCMSHDFIGLELPSESLLLRWIANNDALVYLFADYCVSSESTIIWLWFGWIHFLVSNSGGRAMSSGLFSKEKTVLFFEGLRRSSLCSWKKIWMVD